MNQTSQCVLILLLMATTMGFGQTGSSDCVLSSAANSQSVTVKGKVIQGAHDMLFAIPGCTDHVVLVFAGDAETDVPGERLHRDRNLKRFREYTEATYKSRGKNLCLQCSKYEVKATLTGKLEVASIPEGGQRDQLGFLRDAEGKIVGKAGFGHPAPIYKYRLVIESVSDVVPRKLPRPYLRPNATTNQTGTGTTLLHESLHAQELQK